MVFAAVRPESSDNIDMMRENREDASALEIGGTNNWNPLRATVTNADNGFMEELSTGPQHRWEALYTHASPTGVSWYQRVPMTSIELIEELDIRRNAAIVDVGGGASTLVDALLARDYSNVSVLDISRSALAAAQDRLQEDNQVQWIAEDLLEWKPRSRYDLWHDRAVLHFMVDAQARNRYLHVLREAVRWEPSIHF